MLINKKLGFFGAGAMAEAIVAGLFEKQIVDKKNVSMINRQNQARISLFMNQYQLTAEQFQVDQVLSSDVIILAVKPKDLFSLLKKWGDQFHEKQCIISVVAGITLECIEAFIHQKVSVIRAMPNTSSSVGFSATALAAGKWAQPHDIEIAKSIFSAIGTVITVKEEMMDIVTGLSGSGPAYFYYMVEAMQSAGIKAGLSPEEAKNLTLQTILGAAHMLVETGIDAKKLRQAVTSPQGTTMAGLNVLKEYRFQEAIEQAIFKAKDRSKEMGAEFAEKLLKV